MCSAAFTPRRIAPHSGSKWQKSAKNRQFQEYFFSSTSYRHKGLIAQIAKLLLEQVIHIRKFPDFSNLKQRSFKFLIATLKHCPNVSTTPIMAMGCQQCLPLSVVQLKGKHCRKPHCRNEVVDTHCTYL